MSGDQYGEFVFGILGLKGLKDRSCFWKTASTRLKTTRHQVQE